MTKKEKVVDLKPKAEKISEEQLKKVQTVVNHINRIQLEVGMMEARKHNILHQMSSAQDQLTVMQQEFEKEFGTTDIDITDGTINYPKENGETDKKD